MSNHSRLMRIGFGAFALVCALAMFACALFVTPRFDLGLTFLSLLVACGGVMLLLPLFS